MAGAIRFQDFSRQFKEYRAVSSRGLKEDVNQKAFSIVLAASKLNKKADRARIMADLRADEVAVAQKVRFTKDGRVLRGREIFQRKYPASLYGIVNWKRNRLGKSSIAGAELEAEVAKEWARRRSSPGFMRSGWLAALARLAAAIGKPVSKNTQRRAGKSLGDSAPALGGISPTARFWNDAFSEITSSAKPNEHAIEALQAAVNQETRRMAEYVARKNQERADRFAARILR